MSGIRISRSLPERRPPHEDVFFRRARQGLYALCGTGVASAIGGYLSGRLSLAAAIAIGVLALLAGCLGVMLEMIHPGEPRDPGQDA
jgi:hypothetical protein